MTTARHSRVGFELQERDVEILRYVHRYRLLGSRSHVLPLFGGSPHLLRRLQKLSVHHYLYRLPQRRPHEEAVYAIGGRGADLLYARFEVPRPKVDHAQQNRRLGFKHTRHTLLVASIMVKIELDCRKSAAFRYVSPEEILETWAPEEARRKARRVGGRPFRWQVDVQYEAFQAQRSIEPDWMFGLESATNRSVNWFFLEADRGTEVVQPRSPAGLYKSSLFMKQLQYQASWSTPRSPSGSGRIPAAKNLLQTLFGVRDVRTLFVLDTGYEGGVRLEKCIAASRDVTGGKGSGLFLFAKKEALLAAPDALSCPLTSGRGQTKTLAGR